MDANADLAARLRAAGCAFAAEEAALLRERAGDDAELLEALVRRREAGEPLEPLVGWVDFDGIRIPIDRGVFVPRQRSLLLARRAVAAVRAVDAARAGRGPTGEVRRPPRFLEAFAGAAPIAASVQRAVPGARVLASDRDPRALDVARRTLGPLAGIARSDVLRGLPTDWSEIDVLAAVPPYVPTGELGLLPREAVEHEPREALTAGPDGLEHVRALIRQARDTLAPAGVLLVEMHRGQASRASSIARSHDYTTRAVPGDDGQTLVLECRPAG